MPTQDQTDLLKRIYAAFNRRDIDEVLAAMHGDIDWPNGWEGGRMQGRAAVREFWTRLWSSTDLTVIPESIDRLTDGRIMVSVRQTARTLDGVLVSQGMVGHLYRFEDGLLRAMDIVVDR